MHAECSVGEEVLLIEAYRDYSGYDLWTWVSCRSSAISRQVLDTASYWVLMHSSGDLLSRSNRSQSGVHADKPSQHLRQQDISGRGETLLSCTSRLQSTSLDFPFSTFPHTSSIQNVL